MTHDDDFSRWQEEVLAAYRRIAAAVDPPPPQLRPTALAAFEARDLDAEIALLIADSRTDAGTAVYERVRADSDVAPGRWLLSFEGGGIQAELEVEEYDGRLRVIGLISGASTDGCYLEAAGDRRGVDVDDLGRFIVEDVAHGPIRLRCLSVDGVRVTTAWVTV